MKDFKKILKDTQQKYKTNKQYREKIDNKVKIKG